MEDEGRGKHTHTHSPTQGGDIKMGAFTPRTLQLSLHTKRQKPYLGEQISSDPLQQFCGCHHATKRTYCTIP